MSQDRKALIRLASSMPVGSAGRKAILSSLVRTGAVKARLDTSGEDWLVVVGPMSVWDFRRLNIDAVLAKAESALIAAQAKALGGREKAHDADLLHSVMWADSAAGLERADGGDFVTMNRKGDLYLAIPFDVDLDRSLHGWFPAAVEKAFKL